MSKSTVPISPSFLLAAAGAAIAALAASAQAQDAGAAFSAPELWPMGMAEADFASQSEVQHVSLGEFRFAGQPEEPPSAPADAKAAPAEHDAGELAKKLQNPIASLISVPFQFNFDTGFGPNDADRVTLNIQPVIPFSIGEEWNLITRTIVPVIYQDSLAEGLSSDFGIGDVTQSFFFSPKEPIGGWIIGAGPVALWPTGTQPRLRSESLGFGPTIVALRQDHGWTYGILANHIWSVTDSDDHDQVNNTFLQPFLSYTWPTATTLSLNTESSYNWGREEWTVPLNVLLAQVVKAGSQPIQFQIGARYYADSPDGGPEWGLRLNITFLFP